jgi:predicted Kef-type K+ transport protein
MRIAMGVLASATVLFVAGASGVIGTWGLAIGVGLSVASAVMAAVAMEERERLADDTASDAAYLARVELPR